MKNTSLKFRLNLWYTVLMIFLSICLIGAVTIASHISQRSHAQQTLIKSVERNVDEIEIENDVLDIESDFAYRNSGVYSVIFSDDGERISGAYPDDIEVDMAFDDTEVRKFRYGGVDYFVYDTLMKFNKFEYKIDGWTGEIIGSEAEFTAAVTEFEGELDDLTANCTLSLRNAFDIALNEAGLSEEDVTLMSATLHDYYYSGTVYTIEFFTEKTLYDDVWIRGIMRADSEDSVWDAVTVLAFILLPIFVATASFIGNLIVNRAYKPVEALSRAVSAISSGDDLTERVTAEDGDAALRRLADNCNNMLERLQASFISEKQFTSDASHELRTPLAVILAECEYQLSRDELSEEERDSFNEIRKKALSMKQLISTLLYFTRMEQGKERFDFEKEDMSELVRAVCDDISAIADKNIKVEAHVRENIEMDMDIGLMARLIENLVSNAVKYGKENGHVLVGLEKSDEVITLTVEDNGIGIAKEDIDRIWQRFYRVDKARCSDDGCSGLGLAMVKQIALLHGGTVSVESELGKGSTFKVEFKS